MEPRPFWHPLLAGVALGLVLLLTFLFTGHGLGATGFTTALTAWLGDGVAPEATRANAYLGPLLENGRPLDRWITWEVIGVALGALVSSGLRGRFRLQVEGSHRAGTGLRLGLALVGGALAGFGARLSLGCTSGLGLSGGATLAVAAFLFLMAFFVSGVLVSALLRRVVA